MTIKTALLASAAAFMFAAPALAQETPATAPTQAPRRGRRFATIPFAEPRHDRQRS